MIDFVFSEQAQCRSQMQGQKRLFAVSNGKVDPAFVKESSAFTRQECVTHGHDLAAIL